LSIANSLKADDIELDSVIVAKLDAFTALLHEWNKIHNFTGAKNIKAIHDNIIDAL